MQLSLVSFTERRWRQDVIDGRVKPCTESRHQRSLPALIPASVTIRAKFSYRGQRDDILASKAERERLELSKLRLRLCHATVGGSFQID